MKEAPDPLEAELLGLRPHEVSPGLRRRLAESLAENPSFKLRRFAWLVLVGGVAAACLTGVLFWWGGGQRAQPEPTNLFPKPAPFVAVAAPGPTLLAYQTALARSPEELFALLDKDALHGSQSNPESMLVRAFARSDEELQTLLGDD
jgi:uncharacterized protein YjeT (DUF2065 family)